MTGAATSTGLSAAEWIALAGLMAAVLGAVCALVWRLVGRVERAVDDLARRVQTLAEGLARNEGLRDDIERLLAFYGDIARRVGAIEQSLAGCQAVHGASVAHRSRKA